VPPIVRARVKCSADRKKQGLIQQFKDIPLTKKQCEQIGDILDDKANKLIWAVIRGTSELAYMEITVTNIPLCYKLQNAFTKTLHDFKLNQEENHANSKS